MLTNPTPAEIVRLVEEKKLTDISQINKCLLRAKIFKKTNGCTGDINTDTLLLLLNDKKIGVREYIRTQKQIDCGIF